MTHLSMCGPPELLPLFVDQTDLYVLTQLWILLVDLLFLLAAMLETHPAL